MNKIKMTPKISGNVFLFGIVLLLILSMVLLTKSRIFEENTAALSIGVTIDLLFTIPLLYFLFIKKKNIPNTTVALLFILGMIITSFVIPKEHQATLNWSRTWVFPILEITVVTFVALKVKQSIKRFKTNTLLVPDIFSAIKETCQEILPKKMATLLSTELAVFYYGFIFWKKRTLTENEFTYHKNSGTVSLLIALILIIGIETYVLHILLLKWSITAAWIATALSVYSSIQIFGFLKSMVKRPIILEDGLLKLRYGILSETTIDLNDVSSIEISSRALEFTKTTRKLSPLGELESHNIVLTLNDEAILYGLYGTQKEFDTLAFYVDDTITFKKVIDQNTTIS